MAKRNADVAAEAAPAETSVAEFKDHLPSTEVIDYSQFSGMGREETRAEDYSIPFLQIIQKGSPQVDESSGKYIADAKPGDLLNTVTGQVFSGKTALKVIPCLFHREYVEWKKRKEGGGFIKSYQSDDPIVKTAEPDPEQPRNLLLPNGHQLIDTYYQYVICETEDKEIFPAVISFTSTQVKKVRKWNSMMAQKRLVLPDGKILSDPPVFAFWYEIFTVPEKNDFGSWHGWDIRSVEKPNDRVPDALFREALNFYKQVRSGAIKRAPETDPGFYDSGDHNDIPGFEGASQHRVF